MSVIIFYRARMTHGQISVLHVDPRCPHSQHKTAALIPGRGLEEKGNNLTFLCNKKIERNYDVQGKQYIVFNIFTNKNLKSVACICPLYYSQLLNPSVCDLISG